jgi:hypothetical protein
MTRCCRRVVYGNLRRQCQRHRSQLVPPRRPQDPLSLVDLRLEILDELGRCCVRQLAVLSPQSGVDAPIQILPNVDQYVAVLVLERSDFIGVRRARN